MVYFHSQFFNVALRIRKIYNDNESLEIAALINDVGVLQLRKSQYVTARTCFSEAMRVWKAKLEKGHQCIGETLMNLAKIDVSTGMHEDAIEKLYEALDAMKVNHGEEHFSVALIYFKLGQSLRLKKSYLESLDAFDRSFMIRSNTIGDKSISVAEVLKNIGALCLDINEIPKARNHLGEALNIRNCRCTS
jgi:tetratricopeptide (TPR) repeat protein